MPSFRLLSDAHVTGRISRAGSMPSTRRPRLARIGSRAAGDHGPETRTGTRFAASHVNMNKQVRYSQHADDKMNKCNTTQRHGTESRHRDRKSTRLNSSHVSISYA